MTAALWFFAIAVMNCLRDAGSENPNLLIHLWRKLFRTGRSLRDRISNHGGDCPK